MQSNQSTKNANKHPFQVKNLRPSIASCTQPPQHPLGCPNVSLLLCFFGQTQQSTGRTPTRQHQQPLLLERHAPFRKHSLLPICLNPSIQERRKHPLLLVAFFYFGTAGLIPPPNSHRVHMCRPIFCPPICPKEQRLSRTTTMVNHLAPRTNNHKAATLA